ncbi:MAG: hypothetical protein ACI9EF_003300 [Pseudohongiellaceae bacterium]|jgi:hypothetical protein
MKIFIVLTTLSLALSSSLGVAGAQTVFEPFDALDGFPSGFGRDIELADFDGDGHLDVIEVRSNTETFTITVSLSFGDGHGGFTTAMLLPWASPPIVVSDVDQDGVPDILHGAPAAAGSVFWWTRGLGGGAFAQPVPLLPSMSVNEFPQEIHVGDLDGDGLLDLALLSLVPFTTYIQVLRGDGAGGFVEAASLVFVSSTSAQFSFADLDGDARDDLLYSKSGAADPLFFARSETSPAAVRYYRPLLEGGRSRSPPGCCATRCF